MNEAKVPVLVGVGAVFIDDIVMADGRHYPGVLGGGTVHAMMGAALWGIRAGLSAYVGRGLPDEVLPWLRARLDVGGVVMLDLPQMRAWQRFEADGTRHEEHQVELSADFVRGTQPHDLPPGWQHAPAYYLLQDFKGIRNWQAAISGRALWEPNALAMQPRNSDAFRAAMRELRMELVSPNLLEAQMIYGPQEAQQLLDLMLADGAQAVALRLGAAGSLIATAAGERWQVPVVPVAQVLDQTGAGNTYCGALIAGRALGKSWPEAAAMAAVSASFSLETLGVVDPLALDPVQRDRRYDWTLESIHTLK